MIELFCSITRAILTEYLFDFMCWGGYTLVILLPLHRYFCILIQLFTSAAKLAPLMIW